MTKQERAEAIGTVRGLVEELHHLNGSPAPEDKDAQRNRLRVAARDARNAYNILRAVAASLAEEEACP